MSRYRLYLGPQQVEVDLLDGSRITMSSQLKDYTTIGKRKAATITGVKVVKNHKSDEVVPSYFHINSGFNAQAGVVALLTFNGVEVMRGTLYFQKIEEYAYSCTLVDSVGTLSIALGDYLVKGNEDASKDVYITPGTATVDYEFTMNRQTVRDYLQAADRTRMYSFPLINYDGNTSPLLSRSEYSIYPAIKFKAVIDAVLSESLEGYEIDSDIIQDLNSMYIPYNGPASALVGNPDMPVVNLKYNLDAEASQHAYIPETTLQGPQWGLARYDSTVTDGITQEAPGVQHYYNYRIAGDGDYTFQFHPYGQLNSEKVTLKHEDPDDPNSPIVPHKVTFSIEYLKRGSADWKSVAFKSFELSDMHYHQLNTNTIKITGLKEGDLIAIKQDGVGSDSDGNIVPEFFIRLSAGQFENPSALQNTLVVKNTRYIYSGKQLTINDILPHNYKKADVIKDMMQMFNLYMVNDNGIIRFISYKNFVDTDAEVVDITNDVDMGKVSVEDMANKAANVSIYTYKDSKDKLSEDFADKKNKGFGTGRYVGPHGLAEKTTTATVSTAATVIKKDATFSKEYAHVVSEKQTTELAPRILYLNQAGTTAFSWGSEISDTTITSMFYLSTEGEAAQVSILFDNSYTYTEGKTSAINSTLLNRYYKAELDHVTDPTTKVLTVTAKIPDIYMGLAHLRKRYFVDLGARGTFYGYINRVSGYSPDTKKAKLELIELPNDSTYGQYPSTIVPEVIVYSPKDDGDQLSSTSASGTTSSGSSSIGNYYTKAESDAKFLSLTGGKVIGDTTFEEDVIIHGDLKVLGTGTTVDLQTLEIESNEVVLNHNLGGSENPYSGLSGVRVNRGNQEDYLFQFDEASSLFKIGKVSNLQAVATRESNPGNYFLPYWDEATRMYKTSGLKYRGGNLQNSNGSNYYNQENCNRDNVSWTANRALLGDGTVTEGLIQAKHLNGSYGTILSIDGARRTLIGKSGVTQGVSLFHGNTEVAKTQSDGMLIPKNLGVDGEVRSNMFYTGQVDDLNDINTNVYRGLEVMRYSQGASNKPVDSNNANGLLNIYSHGTGYGKQIAFGDSDDLYIRRMTAGSFGSWHKLYHSGNANRPDVSWDMNNGHINGALTIRGSAANNRIQMWGSAPYLSFHDEASDNRWAYIQAHSGNLLLDVAGINNSLDFRIGGFKRSSVGKWGFGVESGSIYRCFGKHGTSWNNYNYADTTRMGALDVQLVNDASASWIWSVRDHSNTFKAGFQTSNNSNYSQLHLTRRLKVTAWDNVFEFYKDAHKVATIGDITTIHGSLKIEGGIFAEAYETKKTKATNGDLLVTDSMVAGPGTKSTPNVGWEIYVNPDLTFATPFEVGDYIESRTQEASGNIRYWKGRVGSIDQNGRRLNVVFYQQDPASNTSPKEGDTMVRVSGELIRLSSTDKDNPHIELINASKQSLLIGNQVGTDYITDSSKSRTSPGISVNGSVISRAGTILSGSGMKSRAYNGYSFNKDNAVIGTFVNMNLDPARVTELEKEFPGHAVKRIDMKVGDDSLHANMNEIALDVAGRVRMQRVNEGVNTVNARNITQGYIPMDAQSHVHLINVSKGATYHLPPINTVEDGDIITITGDWGFNSKIKIEAHGTDEINNAHWRFIAVSPISCITLKKAYYEHGTDWLVLSTTAMNTEYLGA